jgi:hypothetical protein
MRTASGLAGTSIGVCIAPALQPMAYLVSPPIPANGSSNLWLHFDRILRYWAGYQVATVDVWNGSAWINVFNFVILGHDVDWTHLSADITPYANADLRVRFGWGQPYVNSYGPIGGWSIDNVRVVNGEYFSDRFVNNAAGWSLGPEWAIGDATASSNTTACGGSYGDPGSDADGTPSGGVAGAVLGGNVAHLPAHPFYWLTSPAINTAGSAFLTLRYDRFLNSEYGPLMVAAVEVWNGSSWVQVFATAGVCTVDSSWSTRLHDISAHSNSALQVRFGFQIGTMGFLVAHPMSGWNVDNVSIYDPSGPCSLGFSAYAGPGSIRLSAHCLTASAPPGTNVFNCVTLTAGAYPYGYFFGISPSFTGEVLPEANSASPPFFGPTDADGRFVWEIPAYVPAGLTLYAVTIAIGAGGQPVANSPPVAFTTQ